MADTTATGGIPMNAGIFDYTPFANLRKGLRGWWLTPPRPGMHRLINPDRAPGRVALIVVRAP